MNDGAKATAALGSFGAIFALVPDQYSVYLFATISTCAVFTRLVPPPTAGSRWRLAYDIINNIGMNAGYAANKLTEKSQ